MCWQFRVCRCTKIYGEEDGVDENSLGPQGPQGTSSTATLVTYKLTSSIKLKQRREEEKRRRREEKSRKRS
ncbi:unnamed protein product [Onchocerca ochengi]|uniref:Uncharacterized protein n=1 Tax=Onchocerca ochengi TaxID=42157 RepID=A0A182EL94_ONCOC|nr:unnamed protein product [Onchocerca ochengi]